MSKLASYKEKLNKLRVAVIYLFGSQIQKTETPISDIDIAIVLTKKNLLDNPKLLRKKYLELYDLLSEIYPPAFNKELDIVFIEQASIALQYQVITNGVIIYEFAPEFRANYEEKVIDEYLDFKPVLDYIDKIMVERIA